MRIEVDEVVAQPDFHADGQELSGHRRCRMFAEADTAQGTEGCDDEIRRIWDGPEEKDELKINFAVQLRQPAALIDQGLCLVAKKMPLTVTNWTDGRPVILVRTMSKIMRTTAILPKEEIYDVSPGISWLTVSCHNVL